MAFTGHVSSAEWDRQQSGLPDWMSSHRWDLNGAGDLNGPLTRREMQVALSLGLITHQDVLTNVEAPILTNMGSNELQGVHSPHGTKRTSDIV